MILYRVFIKRQGHCPSRHEVGVDGIRERVQK